MASFINAVSFYYRNNIKLTDKTNAIVLKEQNGYLYVNAQRIQNKTFLAFKFLFVLVFSYYVVLSLHLHSLTETVPYSHY